MNVKIIDNLLDNFLIKYLHQEFLYNTPHKFVGNSNFNDGTKFYNSFLNPNDLIISYICLKITKEVFNLESCKIIRSYLNIQHKDMDGEFHQDDGDVTLLLMITDNPKEGGGEFEYIDEKGKIQSIEYKQNRVIAFDANIKHRGLAYKGNEPRITLAYKLKLN